MNAKIKEVLNLFIDISGEKHNISDLVDDLNIIEKRIPEVSNKIAKLKSEMTDDKYFDASSEIIDRNIELSLQKKLQHLNNRLKTLKAQNSEIIARHKEEEERFVVLNKTLASCQDFLHDLSKFDYEISSNSIHELIDMENGRFDAILNEINNKKENRERTIISGTSISEEIAKLEKKIQTEEDRLVEVRQSLQNKDSYINEEAKSEDLKQLQDLNNELDDIENRRNQIVNSISYQCYQVSEELDKDNMDKDKILNIVRNVVVRLNEYPYLSIEDSTMLSEELRQLSSQRDELTAIIENKKYNLRNKKPYEIRIDYVNQKLNNAKDMKEDYESLLKFIVNQEIDTTIDNLLKLKNERMDLEKAFSSNNKAQLQKKYVDELIVSYEKDLTKTLEQARDIKSKILLQETKIAEAVKEIKSINNEKKLQFDLENQAEKEQDSKMLEEILDKIKCLNNRISVGVTPNQLLDQIEMELHSDEGNHDDEPMIEPIKNKEIETTPVIKNLVTERPEYTFERIERPSGNTYFQDNMTVSPEKYLNDPKDEEKEFSFSPIDNTGYMSFNDAYDIAN